jgi:hypothetical protein
MGALVKIKWEGEKAKNMAVDAATAATFAGATYALDQANLTVPTDTGALKESGKVTSRPKSGTATIRYSSPYAHYIHENPEFNFTNGRPKWLEATLVEDNAAIGAVMGDMLKENFR